MTNVQPTIKPIIQNTVNPIIYYLPDTFEPFDIVSSSITVGNHAGVAVIYKESELGDTIMSVFQPLPIL